MPFADLAAVSDTLSAASSLMVADESLPLGEFGGSYASLYATLALYVICFPGLYSQVKRSVKIDLKQKTYSMPGPEAEDGARPLRQVAAEVMAYWQGNAYKVVEAGEVIVFKGTVEASKSNAFFLSFCTFIGTGTLALVLSNSPLNKIGPIEIGSWYYLMTLSAPFAGLYYWNNAPKEDEVRVRLQTTDDELETEVTVQAPKEKLEIFMRTMNYNEKGMVRVKGILPDQFI